MCTSPRRQLILEFMSNDLEGLKALRYCSTVQSRFSDIKISDNLGFSGYFSIYYKKSFDLVTCDLVTVFAKPKVSLNQDYTVL